MADSFENNQPGLTSPATHAAAVTPADGADLVPIARGIYIGQAGDLAVILDDDSAPVTFVGLAVGVVHPLRAKRVLDTGTTADNIVAVW